MQTSARLRWFWILKLFDKGSGGVRYGNLIALPPIPLVLELIVKNAYVRTIRFFSYFYFIVSQRVLNPWIRVQPIGKSFRYENREILFFFSLFFFFSYVTSRRCYKIFFYSLILWIYLLLFLTRSFTILEFFHSIYILEIFSHLIIRTSRNLNRISVILNLVVSVITFLKLAEPCLKFDGFSVTTLLLRLQRYFPKLERNWEKGEGRGEREW